MWTEQKSGTRGDRRVCHWCSYHSLTPSVIYYWPEARQNGIYLFYIIKKQNTTEKAFLFQTLSTWLESRRLPSTLPTLTNRKKSHLTYSIIYTNEAISLVAMSSKIILIQGSKKITPLSNLTRASFLVEWRLTVKAKLNCEIYKSWRKCWKNRVSFCHQSSHVSWIAWTLPWVLQESKK